MYHPELVQRKIAEYNHYHPDNQLIDYPVEYVHTCVALLDRHLIRNKDGWVTGIDPDYNLTPAQQQFINNERMMCRFSFVYWAERYFYIEHVIDKTRHPIKFNLAQKAALIMIGQMELAGEPIMMLFLKARQLGVSTLFQAIIMHLVLFRAFTTAVVASGDEDKTRKLLAKMVGLALKKMPFWLVRPDLYKEPYKSGDIYWESQDPDYASVVVAQHGHQVLGISRGDTTDAFHFTELLEWLNPEGIIEASFLKAIHPSQRTFGVFESTASAWGEWLHRFWDACESEYPARLTLVRPVFLPYFIGRDIYPSPGEELRMPPPDNWEPPGFVQEHARNCEDYARTSSVLRQVLPSGWRMDIGQMYWYYREYNKAVREPKKFAQWLAEVPSNPKEAFQTWTKSVIDITVLQGHQRLLREPIYPGVKVKGDLLPEVIKPQGVVTSGQMLGDRVTYEYYSRRLKWEIYTPEVLDGTGGTSGASGTSGTSGTSGAAQFTNMNEVLDPLDKLWVWELPELNQKYAMGVDCGEGIGADRTVIEIVKLGNPYQPATQVVEFATDKADGKEVLGLVLMLAQMYTVGTTYDSAVNRCMIAVEMASSGPELNSQLKNWGWGNLYVRQRTERRVMGAFDEPNLGWETNRRTRGVLVSNIITLVKQYNVQINSPWLLNELKGFAANPIKSVSGGATKVKIGAVGGSHDDRIMSFAIALVTGHELDIYRDDVDAHWIGVVEEQKKSVVMPDHYKELRATYSISGAGLNGGPGDGTMQMDSVGLMRRANNGWVEGVDDLQDDWEPEW